MKLSLVFAFVASCALHLAQAADKDTDTDTDTEIITVAFPDGMLREDLGLTNGKPKTYQGAIIDVDPTAITFAMDCSHEDDKSVIDFCVQMETVTVVAGPKTFGFDAVINGLTESEDCTINKSAAVCAITGSLSGDTISFTRTLGVTDVPVTITGGVDKLPTSELSSQTSALSTIPTKTTTDDDDDFVTLTGTVTATPSPSETEEAEETTSTGAAPRVTGAAWAVGMAAVALAV